MVFGAGANVNVNSLVATTADISDNAFHEQLPVLFNFNIPGQSRTRRSSITARSPPRKPDWSGSSRPNVINNGVITAKLGTVQLASGDTSTVDMYGDGLMEVASRRR